MEVGSIVERLGSWNNVVRDGDDCGAATGAGGGTCWLTGVVWAEDGSGALGGDEATDGNAVLAGGDVETGSM